MPLGKVHSVLCTTCQEAVVTEYAYPERRCGYTTATRREGRLIRISCTNSENSPECQGGAHFDRLMQFSFASPGRLHSRGEGQVSRALRFDRSPGRGKLSGFDRESRMRLVISCWKTRSAGGSTLPRGQGASVA